MRETSNSVREISDTRLDLIEGAVTELAERAERHCCWAASTSSPIPILKAVKNRFADVQIVHFDAHCDLRDDYEGQRLSHATVMKRVKELGGYGDFSDRDTIRDETGVRRAASRRFAGSARGPARTGVHAGLHNIRYGCFRSVPGPRGYHAGARGPHVQPRHEIFLCCSQGMNIVGADIVELSPDYDTTFVSSISASKVAREILMLLHSSGAVARLGKESGNNPRSVNANNIAIRPHTGGRRLS